MSGTEGAAGRKATTHYAALGLAQDATAEDIKKAYRKLAREFHPDVAGDNPQAATRFNEIREAYEILSDPIKRARYDRRLQPPQPRSEGRMPGGFFFRSGPTSPQSAPRGRGGGRGNNLDLDDLVNGFPGADFGFGGGTAGAPTGRPGSSGPIGGGASAPPPPSSPPGGPGSSRGEPPRGARQPGRDIHLSVDVQEHIAALGGTVTLHYPRLRLGEDGHSLHRYDEICDLRVPPGTRSGQELRAERMGDSGNDGTYGDLVCDVRVVPSTVHPSRAGGPESSPRPGRTAYERGQSTIPNSPRPTAPRPPGPAPAPAASASAVPVVPISVAEALLGGRIEVDTPQGKVKVAIPACTSSGARLRLRGKGPADSDYFVELRIVTPRSLDAESRELIERFASLNPEDPRTS